MNKKTAELKASLDAVPEYLKRAYEAKHQIIFEELLKEHEREMKLIWWWRNMPFIFCGLSVLFLILVRVTTYPGKVLSDSAGLIIVCLFALVIIILIGFSSMFERGHDFIAKKVEEQVEQFMALITRLGYSPEHGRHGFGPTAIRANLVIKARELLKTAAETIEMRQNLRYGSTMLKSAIDLELTRQKLFDEMFGAATELRLNDPSSGQPYERGEIFAQAESMLSKAVASKGSVLVSKLASYSAPNPVLAPTPVPPPQKPAD